jgi:hypothetical protein
MSTVPHDLNWVEKRAACTIGRVFNEICDGIDEDVRAINEARNLFGDFQFQADLHTERTTVFVGQPGRVPRVRVLVGIVDNQIEVRNEVTKETWRVSIGLNNEGRCSLRLADNSELEQWQFRKMALEGLFFEVRP